MSKVNIAKIAKDVGICSENLVSISESLISISEKVATVAKVIAEIVSEFQGEQDKPAVETKAKKAAPKQIEAKEEKPVSFHSSDHISRNCSDPDPAEHRKHTGISAFCDIYGNRQQPYSDRYKTDRSGGYDRPNNSR